MRFNFFISFPTKKNDCNIKSECIIECVLGKQNDIEGKRREEDDEDKDCWM